MAELSFGGSKRACTAEVLKVQMVEKGTLLDNTAFGIKASSQAAMSDQLNVVFKAVDQPEWSNQQEWYGLSTREDSAFAALMRKLNELSCLPAISLTPDSPIADWVGAVVAAMEGKTFMMETETGVGKKQAECWMPQAVAKDTVKKADSADL